MYALSMFCCLFGFTLHTIHFLGFTYPFNGQKESWIIFLICQHHFIPLPFLISTSKKFSLSTFLPLAKFNAAKGKIRRKVMSAVYVCIRSCEQPVNANAMRNSKTCISASRFLFSYFIPKRVLYVVCCCKTCERFYL